MKWVETELYKGDNDHDDAELPVKVRMHNCQEDRLALRLYEAALSDLLKRVERFLTHRWQLEQKAEVGLHQDWEQAPPGCPKVTLLWKVSINIYLFLQEW